MPKETIRVTADCWIDVHRVPHYATGPDTVYLEIGDDMRMNGMDSPATLHRLEDITALIDALVGLRLQGVLPSDCRGKL